MNEGNTGEPKKLQKISEYYTAQKNKCFANILANQNADDIRTNITYDTNTFNSNPYNNRTQTNP